MSDKKNTNLKSIRYCPAWFGVGIFRLIVLLPFSWQMFIGRRLGDLMRCVAKKRSDITFRNLRLCFADKSEQEIQVLHQQTFQSMGMFLMEVNVAYYMSDRRFDHLIKAKMLGYEYLADALKQGKGVILLSGHMMVLEIAARIFARDQKFSVVYKANRKPFTQYQMVKGRNRYIDEQFQKEDIRGMIRHLKSGKVLWYAPDQDFGRDKSEFVDFMGVQTATVKAIADLARLGDAIVVPLFFARLDTVGCYEFKFLPALENFPSGDYQQDLGLYNQLLGDYIKQYPEQYNWLHRRFKTRPEGEPRVY